MKKSFFLGIDVFLQILVGSIKHTILFLPMEGRERVYAYAKKRKKKTQV